MYRDASDAAAAATFFHPNAYRFRARLIDIKALPIFVVEIERCQFLFTLILAGVTYVVDKIEE